MRTRCLMAVSMVGGLVLLTGCPFAGLLDSISDAIDGLSSGTADGNVIPDGTYAGKFDSTTEWRDSGELYWQGPSEGETSATFSEGALVAQSGDWVDIGDADTVDRGTFQMAREVYDIWMWDYGYEVDYYVTATWKNVPLEGEQYIVYELNSDGTVDLFDWFELTSLDTYDGGRWTIEDTTTGTLAPLEEVGSSGDSGDFGDSGDSPEDILDKKSGKIRH